MPRPSGRRPAHARVVRLGCSLTCATGLVVATACQGTIDFVAGGDAETAGASADGGTSDGAPAGCAGIDARIDGADYRTLPTVGDTLDHVETAYDINPNLRGWSPAGGVLDLVDYSGGTDGNAPKLYTIFEGDRFPTFSANYALHKWDRENDRPGPPMDGYEVTLLGMATTPGDRVELPASGYRIGEDGQQARVLYVGDDTITVEYTLDDSIVRGYAMHFIGVCAEPSLRELYQQSHQAGRTQLPALRGDQPMGVALGDEIKVSVRDSGAFMDPRSRKDWW